MTAPVTKVLWSNKVAKKLNRIPAHIRINFFVWVTSVELSGIYEVRRSLGLHDEPLKGERKGQRSVRLNRAYRAIYIERSDGTVEFLEVIEVNKHEY
ncbi:MAG: hypothetical protein HUU57_07975 [Bdellovibrio sp.]|nr:hypothetical protein [Bdellovibrio sp.]